LIENQSKIFLNLSNHTIPTAPVIFPIKFKVLEVKKKHFKSKKDRSYHNKIPQVKCQNSTLFIRRDTIHSTTQTTCTHSRKHHWNGNKYWTKQ